MPNILTFGDSNTHGTPPIIDRSEYYRFGPDQRWPCLMQRELGPEWGLAEEGLPGRTAQFEDPVMGAHMNGVPALRMALNSHGPLDVLVLMLGTNDVKTRFAATPEMVTGGMAGLLDMAMDADVQGRHGGFKILLVCPPPVEEVGPIRLEFWGGAAKSRALPRLYADLAFSRGVGFLDAGKVIAVSPLDGVHYAREAHGVLAVAVAAAVRAL